MADPALGPDSLNAIKCGFEQFVGMETALHQGGGFALTHKGDGGLGGCVAMGRVDERIGGNIDTSLGGRIEDFGFWADAARSF